jgi:hypothetical protein
MILQSLPSSVKRSPKIGQVRRASTLLVPGLGALPDQCDLGIAFGFGHRTMHGDALLAEKSVMIDLYGVNPAFLAEEIRLNIFVSHDAAGNGRHAVLRPLLGKLSPALRTSNHKVYFPPPATFAARRPARRRRRACAGPRSWRRCARKWNGCFPRCKRSLPPSFRCCRQKSSRRVPRCD